MYTCPLFRGFYFSISCRCSCFQSRVIISVPFPGILFLNEKWIYSKCLELKCFRPLPGDLISQYAFEDQVKDLICFRPLPGDLISQLQILAPSPMQLASFRPLPGDLISQFWFYGLIGNVDAEGFRPLPGDLISQSCPLHA